MQTSKHVPVTLYKDRVWNVLVQVDQLNLDVPISALLLGSRWVPWLAIKKPNVIIVYMQATTEPRSQSW